MNNLRLVEENNFGEVVCCDGCNGPYDNMMGGYIIGSSAYCADCGDKYGYDNPDYEYKDEIVEFFDKEKTFKENVLDFRKRTTGTTDAFQRIFTWD